MPRGAASPILTAESGLTRYLEEIGRFPTLEPREAAARSIYVPAACDGMTPLETLPCSAHLGAKRDSSVSGYADRSSEAVYRCFCA
jgi:hypothetical protein